MEFYDFEFDVVPTLKLLARASDPKGDPDGEPG